MQGHRGRPRKLAVQPLESRLSLDRRNQQTTVRRLWILTTSKNIFLRLVGSRVPRGSFTQRAGLWRAIPEIEKGADFEFLWSVVAFAESWPPPDRGWSNLSCLLENPVVAAGQMVFDDRQRARLSAPGRIPMNARERQLRRRLPR